MGAEEPRVETRLNPSRIFILRPVATILLMVSVMFAGLLAMRAMPVSALPDIEYPTIQIVTMYPGASPDLVTRVLTAPLERQLGQMPGLLNMASQNSAGASVITLRFGLDLPLDVAEQQVQAAINAASSLLPTDLVAPPIYYKVNPADVAAITLAVSSASISPTRLQSLVETRLAQKLSQVSGVGAVRVLGGQRSAVRVQANPRALAAVGLGLDSLRSALAAANSNQAKGTLEGPTRAATISTNDQLRSLEEYRALVVAYRNGAAVRLGDVAEVIEAGEDRQVAAWANGVPAIVLDIQRQPGSNVIETVDRVQRVLHSLTASLPQGVEVKVLSDRSVGIRASITAVAWELAFAALLVIAVMYVFLRSPSATLIPAVCVPLSLMGTLAVMYLAGFSINNLTLMALTIATGFVVDDAIVMVENVSRHLESGKTPLEAALEGAGEISFTIISLTLSLIAVLIPLLFMEDVVGRLFREFSITLAVSIAVSALISLSLTPMMCARLLRARPQTLSSEPPPAPSRWLSGPRRAYESLLRRVVDRPAPTMLVALALLVLTVVLYVWTPKGFFPVQDTGLIQLVYDTPQSDSFAAVAQRQQVMVGRILEDDSVSSVSSFVGVDGINPSTGGGRMLIALKPLGERKARAARIADRLAQGLANLPGINVHLQPVQELNMDDRISRGQYRVSLQSEDEDALRQWVPRLVHALAERSELRRVATDLLDDRPQLTLDIDQDAAGRLGVTTAMISDLLYDAFGQRAVSTVFTQSNQHRVVLEVAPDFRSGPESLDQLYINLGNGRQVPLSDLATVTETRVPAVIYRSDQSPANTVSFDLAPGVSLDRVMRIVADVQRELGMPASIRTQFEGQASAFQNVLHSQLWLILAAVLTMYIVLGMLYESFVHPVTILSTLPAAGIGALLALAVAGSPLNVVAIIGIVLLIGIVKKNAILMIDFALSAQRAEGLSAREAIFQAALQRFRPILMTTLAALFGALPLMLGQGMGAELRHPLGLTMVGGLLASQLLTLFTTPAIYLGFDGLRERLAARRSAAAQEAA